MKRYLHNLSHYHLTTCNMGKIIPVGLMEVLPNDSFRHSSGVFLRVTPLLKPVMHNVEVQVSHYYVPNRIIWDGWTDFIMGKADAEKIPMLAQKATVGSLLDYLGVKNVGAKNQKDLSYSLLPIRAYNKIYNDHLRDLELQEEVDEDSLVLQDCLWEKDYFTSARPTPQAGPAVTVPLGDFANVINRKTGKTEEYYVPIAENNVPASSKGIGSGHVEDDGYQYFDGGDYRRRYVWSPEDNPQHDDASQGKWSWIWEKRESRPETKRVADLSTATALDIEDIRRAFNEQKWAEARMLFKDDYQAFLKHMGSYLRDSMLHKPRYLAGGKQSIDFSQVLNTGSAQGAMTGHGVGAMRSNTYKFNFKEHGWVVTLMWIRPRTVYSSGLERKFSREMHYDYFNYEFADEGNQEIKNKEVYHKHSKPDGVFGYQSRYSEYTEEKSKISGEFQTSASWDWHYARLFNSDVALNKTFIECKPTKRVYAEQTRHSCWVKVMHNIKASRQVKNVNIWRTGV